MKKIIKLLLVPILFLFNPCLIFSETNEELKQQIIKDFYLYAEVSAEIPKHEVDRFLKRKREDFEVFKKAITQGLLLNNEIATMLSLTPSSRNFSESTPFEEYLVTLSLALKIQYDYFIGMGMSREIAIKNTLNEFKGSFPRSDYLGEWFALMTSGWHEKYFKKGE